MAIPFFRKWFQPLAGPTGNVSVYAYQEQPGRRDEALREAAEVLVEHYVGIETVLRAGGFEKAAATIKNSLPATKRIQSGDLGEIFAFEFLHSQTRFRAPIKKLRYKSDRNTPLHGNDLIAVDHSAKRPIVLKGECKRTGRECRNSQVVSDGTAPLATVPIVTPASACSRASATWTRKDARLAIGRAARQERRVEQKRPRKTALRPQQGAPP